MKISVVGLRGIPNVQGGIETHCEKLYPLIAEGAAEIVIYGRKRYKPQYDEFPNNLNVKWLPCVHSQYLETVSYMFFAFAHILFRRPQIIHIHGVGPGLFAPLFRMAGCKVILTHHGKDYERSKWNFFAKKVIKLGEKFGLKFADRIIVLNSQYLNEPQIKPFINKVCVIPNGAEISEEKCNGGGNYIFAIGRFVKEKGFSDLASAISLLRQTKSGEESHPKLILAGSADHETKYTKQLIKEAKGIGAELPGFVQGAPKKNMFLNCRLFVIPSYHEGLPFTLLEAMSYGCDILASDIPAHRELGLPEECYYPVGNVKKLTEKIDEKLSKPFVPHNYDEILKEKYDWNKIAKKTMEVYR